MSWSDLPFDVRQKCVKNLDFSTCICLRACSKSDRQLVDSVPLKLPRVRFARKLERALLVFHTGVNEYLRIEYRGDDGELMVLRNTPENSDRKTKRKIKLEISPYDLATSTFVGILSRENLELGTLEIGQPDHEKDGRIEKLLIPNNFRFQKIAYDCTYRWKLDGQKTFYNSTGCTNQEMIHYTFTQQENVAMSRHQVMFVGDVCDFRLVNGVKVVSNRPVFYVNVPQESPGVPMKVLFDYLLCASKRLVPRGVLHVRFPHTDEKTGYEMFKACPGEFHQFDTGIMMKRIAPTHGFVHRFYCSPCGFYVQLLKENAEKDLESAWPHPCGIGNLCSIHADPFEHWYYNSFFLRLGTEHFWCNENITITNQEDGEGKTTFLSGALNEEKVRKFKETFERLEKEHEMKMKEEEEKKKGNVVEINEESVPKKEEEEAKQLNVQKVSKDKNLFVMDNIQNLTNPEASGQQEGEPKVEKKSKNEKKRVVKEREPTFEEIVKKIEKIEAWKEKNKALNFSENLKKVAGKIEAEVRYEKVIELNDEDVPENLEKVADPENIVEALNVEKKKVLKKRRKIWKAEAKKAKIERERAKVMKLDEPIPTFLETYCNLQSMHKILAAISLFSLSISIAISAYLMIVLGFDFSDLLKILGFSL